MTDTQFLTTEEGKISRKRALKRRRVLGNAVTYAFAGVAVCCFIGLLVAVIMLNFNQDEATLFYILTGAFAGGSALFAACSFAAAQAARKAYLHELDFKELLRRKLLLRWRGHDRAIWRNRAGDSRGGGRQKPRPRSLRGNALLFAVQSQPSQKQGELERGAGNSRALSRQKGQGRS